MKEKILDAFKALGFEMEELEGFGYGFEYEGKHFLYMYNEDDEDFLNLAVCSILKSFKLFDSFALNAVDSHIHLADFFIQLRLELCSLACRVGRVHGVVCGVRLALLGHTESV